MERREGFTGLDGSSEGLEDNVILQAALEF